MESGSPRFFAPEVALSNIGRICYFQKQLHQNAGARVLGEVHSDAYLKREGIPMQSALWKIVTAIGIVGIGTLVVLEVHQNLQPMPAGSASGQHVAGGANGEPGTSVDSPFYSADSADGE
ncbi:MAG: hypothetical protein ACK58T_07300, partial [Phycisphaerae bacterium]